MIEPRAVNQRVGAATTRTTTTTIQLKQQQLLGCGERLSRAGAHVKPPTANRHRVNFRARCVAKISAPLREKRDGGRDERRGDERAEDENEREKKLTDNGEVHGVTYGRRRGHLTLVCAGISSLGVFYL